MPQEDPEREAIEAQIRTEIEAERFDSAATVALESYGGEVLGYLHTVAPRGDDADELFSMVCEHVWRGLPNFRSESTFRTWLYAVARNIVRDHQRARIRRRRRIVDGPASSMIEAVAERVRSSTALHLKTGTKTRLQKIRETLDADDQTLLVLRLDRKMSWSAIARVITADEPEDASRAAARLRKRFERIKTRVAQQLVELSEDPD